MRRNHRAAGLNETKYIRLDRSKCRACWECLEACPNDVINRINLLFHKHAVIGKPDLCKGCLKCVRACLYQAITPCKPVINREKEKTG